MKKFRILIVLALALLSISCSGQKRANPDLGADKSLCRFQDLKIWDTSPEEGFSLSLSKEYTREGETSLKVIYPVGGYPSINTKKLAHNWGKYDYFCVDIFNPQEESVNFVIRLDDTNDKVVNIGYSLKPGWNEVKIPRSRIASGINPENISFVVLFLNNPGKNITLYFDNMRLIRPKASAKSASTAARKPAVINETYSPVTNRIRPLLTGQLQVSVVKLKQSEDAQVLVSSGIPFAPGQLFSEKNFAVFDSAGKEISIAVKVLARWPIDNSIRSLLVQFPYLVEKKYAPVTLQLGLPRTTPDSPITEVTWVLPEGYVILPARWLCVSEVIGEQVPMQMDRFSGGPQTKYEANILNIYPAMRDKPWTDDIRNDGYYDIAHVFYQLYVRSGNDDYLKSARKEALHYREEILAEGPEKGSHKCYKETRYVYVEGMIDDYLLTGDTKSLVMAGYMVEYLKKSFNPDKAFFPKDGTRFWTEREAAFPLLGIISFYELTGDKTYLEAAHKIMLNLYRTQNEWPDRGGFIHNLYSHDPEEGARPDEYGGSPFMTGLLLEAIVKYHQNTNSNIAKDSIFKALDWLTNEALAPDGSSFVYSTADKNKNEGAPDLNLLIVHAFGYGYKISGYSRSDYLESGQKIFERGAQDAWLGDRKHFNQSYRSSGHYLAYIQKTDSK